MILIRLILSVGLGLIALALRVVGESPSSPVFRQPRHVEVMAHGGARLQAPENSSAALEHSIADGVEWVEVDVQLSRDGRHVLVYDADLGSTTDGLGSVETRTLDDLKSLDAGSKFAKRFAGAKINSLEEALTSAKGRVRLDLHCIRVNPARLVQAVLEAGMENQSVVSADPNLLVEIRSEPGGDRLALVPKWHPTNGLDAFGDLKPEAVEINAVDVTPELCQAFHNRGVRVQARALGAEDRPTTWDRLIDAGVDRIQTDLAEEILARDFLKRRDPSLLVKIAHHRGSSRYAPENTLPAYEKAIRLGADFVEFDIRMTSDGIPMLLHDGRLDRTTNVRGPIRDHPSNEVAGLDAGAWFGRSFIGTRPPTLEAFFKTIGQKVELYVDAKDIPPERLVEVLRAQGLIEHSVVYQSADYLARLRSIEPRLRRMPPLSDLSQIEVIADRLEPYAFDTRWGILSKPLIDRCHARGIKVFSDSIGLNESEVKYRQAILDGIDLIQTDHPIRVLRAIANLGTSKN